MTIDISSVSTEKVLSKAIKAENDAVNLYMKLKKSVNNFVLKEKLSFLISEEKKHQKMLEALFSKMFPGKSPDKKEKSLIPRLTIALKEEMSVPDMLELGMEAEKAAEEVYDTLSQEVDERGVKEILQYLASMELGHYSLLKGEYDLCVKDEMYFERGDFQYDMVHIGP
jgi:rubrerythrin